MKQAKIGNPFKFRAVSASIIKSPAIIMNARPSLIIRPDFPENKEDWPFLWGQNEYVISMGASHIFTVNAVNELLNL